MTASLLALALWGCTPSATPPADDAPVDDVDPPALGWISEVVLDPDRFSALVDAERPGWAALHAHRYLEAHASLRVPAHRARAAWHLAVLHSDLARLTGHAHDRLYREWEARGGLPDAARPVAALAARCTGVGDASRWHPDVPVTAPLHALDLPEGHPWSARAALHRQAQAHPRALLDGAPLVVEPADGFERRFHDPCVHSTLARVWTRRLEADLGRVAAWADAGLGGLLFAPWLTAGTLTDDLARREPGLLGLGTTLALPPLRAPDEVQPARELASRLDAGLDVWSRRLARSAGPEGVALLTELGLVDAYRQDALIVRARAALLDDRPQQAAVLLRLAQDPDLGPGPGNPPELYALLAEALLRTGRVREALDALHPLLGEHAELRALVEVLGDLAVLRGLDRPGDAREP